MNGERPDSASRSAVERRVRDLVRSLPPSEATPEYRARLRHAFVHGSLPGPASRWVTPRGRQAVATAGVIAIALVVAGLVAWLGRPPAWRLEAWRGDGEFVVDGRVFAATALDAAAADLPPGARVQLRGDVEVELLSAGNLALQLVSGADVTLPRLPGRWLPRRVIASVWGGEVRIATGPRFRGAVLRIVTPEADIEVTGTTLAVIRDSTSTCVCTFAGSVRMAPIGGTPQAVIAGKRRFIYNDGRTPALVDIDAMESMKLQMFHDGAAPKLDSVR